MPLWMKLALIGVLFLAAIIVLVLVFSSPQWGHSTT